MNKNLIKNQTIQTNTILRGLKIPVTEEEQIEYDKMIDLEIDDLREEHYNKLNNGDFKEVDNGF